MTWFCRLFHWRRWVDVTSGTEALLAIAPVGTRIQCPTCRRSITVSIVRAARAARG